MNLDYATLDALRARHPAWRLLNSPHAPLVASFLQRVFVTPNVRVMAVTDLTEALEDEWGDIDTHGFAILDQLRSRFDHVESFLMDRATLMAHEALWGDEKDQVMHNLPRLTVAEHALFDELRDNRIRADLRLEQERVGYQWVKAALDYVSGGRE